MGCSNSKDDTKFSLASKLYCCRKGFEFYDKLMCAGTNNDTNRKMAVLKNLDIFILDNSIRESTVTQVREHIKDDKYAIWNAVRATGIQNCIIATFSSLPSVEDQWLEELRDTSMLDPSTGKCHCYAFSELYDAFDENHMPLIKDTLGMTKIKLYKVPNVVFEMTIKCPSAKVAIENGLLSNEKICEFIKLRLEMVHKFSPDAKIFINFRDACTAFGNKSLAYQMITITKVLSQLDPFIRPFGIIFEDPSGAVFPWTCGDLCKTLRKVMDDNNWKDYHLLAHIHKNFGTAECCVLESVLGKWCKSSKPWQ
jgi:hypothetical protein